MMNILNIKFRSSFLSTYHNQNKKLLDIGKNILNDKTLMSDDVKIDQLKIQLSKAQTAESHIQEGVSLLQEKNKAVTSLADMSKKLEQLSSKYNSGDVTSDDKKNIEKQAKEIINTMNNILNSTFGDKSIFGEQQINVETSHGSDIVINMKLFDISIDSDVNKDNKKDGVNGFHIEGKLDIKSILEDTTRIEKNLIKPLNKYSDNLNKQMVGLVNDIMYQNMIVDLSVKKLLDFKAIDGFIASKILNNSDNILKNSEKALDCQSSNLESSTVSRLLN